MLTVLSYNILEGGGNRLPAIADVIRKQQPDMVALLEANSQAGAEWLGQKLRMQLAFGRANSAFHVGWLSRLPIQRMHNHRLPVLTKTLLEIEVIWDGAPLRFFATHLGSFNDRSQPEDEVPAILEVLHPLAGLPHLLVGDFNALAPGEAPGSPPRGVVARDDKIPGAAIRQLLEAGYVDCYRTLHPTLPGYSFAAQHPWLRIDYIFASPKMAGRLRACDLVTKGNVEQASDHLPIWAEFD